MAQTATTIDDELTDPVVGLEVTVAGNVLEVVDDNAFRIDKDRCRRADRGHGGRDHRRRRRLQRRVPSATSEQATAGASYTDYLSAQRALDYFVGRDVRG